MQTTPTPTTTAECDEVNPPPTPAQPRSLPPLPPSVAVQLPTLRCSARASRKGTYSRMGSAESAEPTSSKQCHRRQRRPRSSPASAPPLHPLPLVVAVVGDVSGVAVFVADFRRCCCCCCQRCSSPTKTNSFFPPSSSCCCCCCIFSPTQRGSCFSGRSKKLPNHARTPALPTVWWQCVGHVASARLLLPVAHRSPAPADDALLLCAQLLNQWWRRL